MRNPARALLSVLMLMLMLMLGGCASAFGERMTVLDGLSGRTITLVHTEERSSHLFAGEYSSPQLGSLTLETSGDRLTGTYVYELGACKMQGALAGTIVGNVARFVFAERSHVCVQRFEASGQGTLWLAPKPAESQPTQDQPQQLFGERSFGAMPRAFVRVPPPPPDVHWPISAQSVIAKTASQPAAPPPTASPCTALPGAQCGRVDLPPPRRAPEHQARIDQSARALGRARQQIETRCSWQSPCDRTAAPFRAVFGALEAAEERLLHVQRAADRFSTGDGRSLDLLEPCFARELRALITAMRAASLGDVPGLDGGYTTTALCTLPAS